MPTRSTLARLQQVTTLLLAFAALGWLVYHWPSSPMVALAGALSIVFGYSLFLAAEFALLRVVARDDAVPSPTWADLAGAWWRESCHMPRVFAWRQPFRWREVPDQLGTGSRGKRGIVLVHGFVCNRGFWTPWMKVLRARGHPFAAVNLEPVFGSIDRYAPIIDEAVQRVTQATGLPPVLVCHSMGGVAARAWLRSCADNARRVHQVVTIGSPHHGTWIARASHAPNGRQMRQRNPWLRQLADNESARPRPAFTCWYSNCDNIVFPPTTATLPGADNKLLPGAAHVDLAFRPQVLEHTLSLLGPL